MDTIRIPAWLFGEPYHSLDRTNVTDLGTGEVLASLGLVSGNQIAVNVLREGRLRKARDRLQKIPIADRIAMSVAAASHFQNDTLDCGGVAQTIGDYHLLLSRTSGLPYSLARANTARIVGALRNTEAVVHGLSRNLPLDVFDNGVGEQNGTPVRIVPRIDGLGCCMPGNSPGVHVTWLMCLPFGIPPLIRPGSAEPFTPWRLIQAHIAAGYPPEVFGYYPCNHQAAARIPELTRGAIVFGSDATVQQWAGNPLVKLHGSGFSKLIIGDDLMGDWPSLMPEMKKNVAANSGRSCFNVSRIIVPKDGRKFADVLAASLATMVPRSLGDTEAELSAMAMPERAAAANAVIEAGLKQGGAFDMSAQYRRTDRLVKLDGRTYLLPTVIYCESGDHPLAKQEFLFPYAAVVEASNDDAFAQLGFTLSLAVYTNNPALIDRARRSDVSLVSINVATPELDRRQPHEEDLLWEVLYKRLSYVA